MAHAIWFLAAFEKDEHQLGKGIGMGHVTLAMRGSLVLLLAYHLPRRRAHR